MKMTKILLLLEGVCELQEAFYDPVVTLWLVPRCGGRKGKMKGETRQSNRLKSWK